MVVVSGVADVRIDCAPLSGCSTFGTSLGKFLLLFQVLPDWFALSEVIAFAISGAHAKQDR